MDCRVVVEAAVPVYDVSEPDEAVRIAVSKTGGMLNPDLSYVEIGMGERHCSDCGGDLEPAFIAADEGLVALELEMTVFNVEGERHASRIARKEIGQQLTEIPLEVLRVEPDGEDAEDDAGADGDGTTDAGKSGDAGDAAGDGDAEEDLLPEFDELIEDS
jgi:uncharacterized protein (UPF0212 family)